MGNFTAVDTEGPVKDWLRTQVTDAGARVYLNLPTSCPVDGSGNALAYITLGRVSGAPEGGDLRIEAPVLSFSCRAATKAAAARLGAQVASVFESAAVGTVMGPITFLGASVELGPVPIPDPDVPPVVPARSRYVVDIAMRVRPS